jgi:hypothetical protein
MPKQTPMATLRFFADDLAPEVITRIVAKKPSAAAAKGAPYKRRSGQKPVNARVGTWFITTQDKHLGTDPDQHLAWVVGLAVEHLWSIRNRVPDVRADLSLLVHDARFKLSDLPRDLLRRAVEIGDLEIEVPERGQDIFLNLQNLDSELAAA